VSDDYLIVSKSSNEVYWEQGLFPPWSKLNTFVNVGLRPRGSGTEPHYHDCDELWLFPDAHGQVWLDERPHPMTPNTAVYTPMGTVHRFQLFEETAIAAIITPLERQKRPGHLLIDHVGAHSPPHPYYLISGPPTPTVSGFVIPGEMNTGPFPVRGPRCPLSELRLVTFAQTQIIEDARLPVNEYWLGMSGTVQLRVHGLNVELGPGDVALLRQGVARTMYSVDGGRAVLARE
jgi:mannose-6-phosphate isomerase-like protein (cupin superfamily)